MGRKGMQLSACQWSKEYTNEEKEVDEGVVKRNEGNNSDNTEIQN